MELSIPQNSGVFHRDVCALHGGGYYHTFIHYSVEKKHLLWGTYFSSVVTPDTDAESRQILNFEE